MEWNDLPTNYTDAVFDGLRKYTKIDNEDGTVSFRDDTVYRNKENSFFGANDANQMNAAANHIMTKFWKVNRITLDAPLSVDSTGKQLTVKITYYGGDDPSPITATQVLSSTYHDANCIRYINLSHDLDAGEVVNVTASQDPAGWTSIATITIANSMWQLSSVVWLDDVLYHDQSETAHADIRKELEAVGDDISAQIATHNRSSENVHPYILQSIPAQINAHNNSKTAHADIRAALENISSVTQYGVRFEGAANSGDTVTRLYDAQGLVAGVGTDTQTAVNDFDHIYPWSARRRCCGTFDETGNFVVNAYEGEAGYATDGTGGEVWVEHSLFYYKHIYDGDAEEILISAFPIGGFLPAPIFVLPDGTVSQKAYTAAYPMATVDGKATSRSGVFSDICSLNSAMTTARTLGKNYTATTTAEWYTDCLYMWVEFATRDLQSVMAGASSLPYDNTNTATVAETNVNRMIVANAVADAFVVGQTIGIGTSLGGTQIASNRVVTAIDVYDADNKAISFDGSPVNIAVGNIVWSSVYINGTCDHVLSSSGSPVSNTSGKYNCIYRGKETPYGNAFEWISDILLKREGGGTIEDPYIYDIYYLPDLAKYANGAITDDYIKLNYQLPADNGYIKKLGFDSRYPHLRLPAQLGGSSSAYYTDYYYPPANDICAAHVGGFVSYGKNDGPCYWYCHYQPTLISNSRRARLSYRRGNLSGSSTLDSLGVTATAAELNYCDGLTGNIQNQIDALADGDPTTPIDGGTF